MTAPEPTRPTDEHIDAVPDHRCHGIGKCVHCGAEEPPPWGTPRVLAWCRVCEVAP